MVIKRNKAGFEWQEPPYTAAELREIEKNCYAPPIGIVHRAKPLVPQAPAPLPKVPEADGYD